MFKNGIDSYCKFVASEHRKKPFALTRFKVIEQKGKKKQGFQTSKRGNKGVLR